jgi:acetyl-CoA carboxylase carboxyltransferase component
MSGPENIKRQHDGGKLTVRERIDRQLDSDSFHEYGAHAGSTRYENGKLVKFRPANLVLGTGRINRGRVVVGVR